MPIKSKRIKTKKRQKHSVVRIFIKANNNNSIITLTDLNGKVISWASAGSCGFKGTKKSTPFAAQKASERVLDVVKNVEASSVHLEISGAGMGIDSFLRVVQSSGLQIESIKDVTEFPFGGPKSKNRRRV